MADYRALLSRMHRPGDKPMDEKTAREIRYAKLLCRYGRIFCIALGVIFAFIAVVGLGVALFGSGSGMGIDVGSYVLRGEALSSPAARLWALCVVLAMFGLLFAGLRFMFVLFGNLEQGEIFTETNV